MMWLGFFVFIYTWSASLFLQLWVIPLLFPDTSVEGLVVIDSTGFNEIAKAKASEIAILGWSAWELKPESQSPAGIASFFYTLWGSVPTSILPFNAIVHAVTACVVMRILSNFFTAVPALIGALVFALNPASFEWVAQIHRDGIFILGNMLVIMGIVNVLDQSVERRNYFNKYYLFLLSAAIFGTLLIWVARTYWLQISLLMMAMIFILFMSVIAIQKNALNRFSVVHFVVLFVLVASFHFLLIRTHSPDEQMTIPLVAIKTYESDQKIQVNESDQKIQVDINHQQAFLWKLTKWLPQTVEARMYRIAVTRQAVNSQGGGTLVDADRTLDSAVAILGYLPRAFQLGVFSPLPEYWGGKGSTPAMTLARKVVGATTLVFYFCLLGAFIGFCKMIRVPQLWSMFTMCSIGIVIYAVVYPNIGTLLRYRYGFYMLLIGFGVAFWINFWMLFIEKRRKIKRFS